MEYRLYGMPSNEINRFMEVLLLSNGRSMADIEKVKAVASSQGFHSFRVATYNGEAPDFTKVIAI